jgi:hypothetical protein
VSDALLDPSAAPLVRDIRKSVTASIARTTRRKVPMAALVPALLVAVLGAVPSLVHVPAQVAQTWSVLRQVAPSFLRVAPQAIAKAWGGPKGTAVVMIVWALAAMLVAAGMGIAKQQSKKLMLDGGRR